MVVLNMGKYIIPLEKIKKKKKKKDNSKKNDYFIFCRSCNATITNDHRSTFDKRYCGDCL